MRVAVFGCSGFIGSKFIEDYTSKYDMVYCVVRDSFKPKSLNFDKPNVVIVKSNFIDSKNLEIILKDVDVIVYSIFDHTYRNNIELLKFVLNISKKVNAKKFIYFSTFSIYDPFLNNKIEVGAIKSTLKDPYTILKLKEYKIVKNFIALDMKIKILIPTVVMGSGGSWDNYFRRAALFDSVVIPFNGICPVVDVSHVTHVLHNSIIENAEMDFSEEIINGDNSKTWSEVYCKYMPCSKLKIIKSRRVFHRNFYINILLILWLNSYLFFIFNPFFILYKRKSISKNAVSGGFDKKFYPVAITRALHFLMLK